MTRLETKTDIELVKLAQQNSQMAYTALMKRHYEGLQRYVNQIIRNNTFTNDVVQETFDKAFSKLHLFDDAYPFTAWLYRIARNTAIDFMRKYKSTTLHIDYGSGEELTVNEQVLNSGAPSPEEDMIHHQEEDIMKNLIKKMQPKYRRIIEMRYIKDYPYEEIARNLNIPLGTVKAQLFRAKNILIKQIYEMFEHE
ncbi:MAG: RNA polymerase sigma factor [Prevotellaceae bacterium]|nr:RNA polymerase sigma factor [Prevotellaceae bacterium]